MKFLFLLGLSLSGIVAAASMQRRLAPKQIVADVKLKLTLEQARDMGTFRILNNGFQQAQQPDFTPDSGTVQDQTQRWVKAVIGAFCVTYDIAPTNCYTWVKLKTVGQGLYLTFAITYPAGTTATEVYKVYQKQPTPMTDATTAYLQTTFIAAMVDKVAADATLTGYCANGCPVTVLFPSDLRFRWLSGGVLRADEIEGEAAREAGKSTSGAMSAVGLKVGIMGVVGVAMAMM